MIIKTGKSMGLELSEYQGKYSIVQGFEKDGAFKPEWCRKSRWDKDSKGPVLDEKNTPLKVFLGEKEQAIEVLEALLTELRGGSDGDVPF